MAVAYISDADQLSQTGASVAFTAYAISGTDPVVLLLIALDSATATITSVVPGAGIICGTPVEVKAVRKDNTYTSIWVVPGNGGTPLSGTDVITVNFSASVNFHACALLGQNADQTTPCPLADAVSTTGTTSPLSLTPTNLTANDMSVGIGANTVDGDAPVFTPTETVNSNSSSVNAAGGYKLGTGAVTVTWGTASAHEAMVAVRVVAVGGGGGATVALEWKAPAVQLVNHHHTSIINMRATAPAVVPYLRTTATRVTNPLDWVTVTPDVIWTDG